MAKEVVILVDVNNEEKNVAKEKKQSSKKKLDRKVTEIEVIEKVEEPKGTIATLLNKEVEVKVENDSPKTKPTTMVRILMKEDHRCNIGGNWYCFTKGKHYNVPENVKNILMRANKLLPL